MAEHPLTLPLPFTTFATALYYSGFTLTTLGVGDLVPKTGLWRLVTVLESAVGFSIITASLTYLLSVYNALTRRNAFALSLHYRAAGEASAIALLIRLKGYGKFEPATQEISNIARDLLSILESHHAYPVLHYFRLKEPYYALARMEFISMDLVTLIKTALHPHVYQPLIRSSAMAELEGGGLDMLFQLSDSFLAEPKPDPPEQKTAWRRGYFRAIRILKANNIETVTDIEAGADDYVALRSRWHKVVVAMAQYMDYSWDEIAPAEEGD